MDTQSILDQFTGSKHSFTYKLYDVEDSELIILKRKHQQKQISKPPFYLFDLTRKSYVSSLKPTKDDLIFDFDVRMKNDNFCYYKLKIENQKIRIEKAWKFFLKPEIFLKKISGKNWIFKTMLYNNVLKLTKFVNLLKKNKDFRKW